jgi:hypothetical protein
VNVYYFHLLCLWVFYCYITSCTHVSSFCCLRYLTISQIQCQALFLGLSLVACCLISRSLKGILFYDFIHFSHRLSRQDSE